ncbi:MAG TPA: protease pro-enzyme activation domain-containing protein [Mycobacteriales bacterium]|nr:protease pro-enzyme activation domain-containing protein [Mycobacteriales bacterium]
MRGRLSALLCALGLSLAGAPADASPLRIDLAHTAPSWATPAAHLGPVPRDALVDVQVVLPWHDAAAARALVDQVSNPAAPTYRRYLTPTQFRARFAPRPATVRAVSTWLRQHGLTIGTLPANRLYVPARGSAAAIEAAFGTRLARYRVGGLALRAPEFAPSLPRGLATKVVGVRGLADELTVIGGEAPTLPPSTPLPDPPKTPLDSTPPAAIVFAKPCSAADGSTVDTRLPRFEGKRAPAVVCSTSIAKQRAAYGVTASFDGTGQTVAIVGSHAIQTLPGDVAEWSKRRGLPQMRPGQLSQVYYPGAHQTPTHEPYLRPQVWSLQAHMLVENIHAMAPGADIVYVGTTSAFDLANGTTLAVDAHLGDIVMNGWYNAGESGANAASVAQISQTAQQAAATGISLLFASGSIGDNSAGGARPSPAYPANEPLVTAVGSTSLIHDRSGRRTEVGWAKAQWRLTDGVWEEDPVATFRGSGGGTSTVHAQPAYQKGVVPQRLSKRADSTHGRTVPDVAVNGDAETGIVIGLTQRFPDGVDRYAERRHASGESATAIFAGLVAIANHRAGTPLGFLNPAMYVQWRTGFRDVTAHGRLGARVRMDHVDGATTAKGTVAMLKVFESYQSNPAARGYDTSTGLGSPTATWLALVSRR